MHHLSAIRYPSQDLCKKFVRYNLHDFVGVNHKVSGGVVTV